MEEEKNVEEIVRRVLIGVVFTVLLVLFGYIFLYGYADEFVNGFTLEHFGKIYIQNVAYGKVETKNLVRREQEYYTYAMETALNEEDAIRKCKNEYGNKDREIIETAIDEETPNYYLVKNVYYRSFYGNNESKDQYVYFKDLVVNLKDRKVNMSAITSDDMLRRLASLLFYTQKQDVVAPTAKNTKDAYIITYYDIDIVYGDYGLHDNIKITKGTFTIDKATGHYSLEEDVIREVEGKFREKTEKRKNGLKLDII